MANAESMTNTVPTDDHRKTAPVVIWAGCGAACLIFFFWIWAKWITGPFFKTVEYGPSVPPTWMKTVLIVWQAAGILLAVYLIYKFVVQPWRRDRHVGFDGMIGLASFFVVFWDAISNYFGNWFTYNAYMINFGSWFSELPGWLAQGKPGAMISYPILFIFPFYIYCFIGIGILGCWVMRTAKNIRPSLSNLQLVGICFVIMFFVDILLEGCIWAPMGIIVYIGGHWGIFPESYHKFPLHEAVCVAATFTWTAGLRYFKNDKGETLCERGIEDLRISNGRKHVLRFLAMVAYMSLIVLVAYHLGSTFFGANSTEWSAEFQKRSYLTNHLCGDETTWACPSPNLPNPRSGGQATHVGPNGEIYGPDDKLLAPAGTIPGVKVVPFVHGEAGGGIFHGPIF
jgi:hypothetical protein